jgi:organic radical activating enzyme
MGMPSIFIRLQGCNLLCGNPQGNIKGKTQSEIDKMQGDNATWTCDSIETWLTGEEYTPQQVVDELEQYKDELMKGAQIVLTGGEPLLQAKELMELIPLVRQQFTGVVRFEIETNGTVMPPQALREPLSNSRINQFNISPKLSNSGMSKKRRIKDDAIKTLAQLAWKQRGIFKFVISTEADYEEMVTDYLRRFELPKAHVWLMPACSTQEQYEVVSDKVIQLCRKEGFMFSSRLQINVWNQTTGV